MATIRILATVCAALFAGLALTFGSAAPARAQAGAEAPPGRPLNLLPHLGKTKKVTRQARSAAPIAQSRVAESKPTHRVARRGGVPARTFARGQNAATVANRQDDSATVTPDQDRLGYQAEGKTQPPIDSWLRSPLPPAPPVAIRRPAAAAINPVASPAFPAAVNEPDAAADPVAADAVVPDAAAPDPVTADLSAADNVQVADSGEINEIDLAADQPAAPTDNSGLNGLLALLAGALTAAVAAGLLFVRRRQPLRV